MIKIYHNPRCRKSRAGLKILEDSGKHFETVKYLDETPTETELSHIIKLLNINPIDLVRKNEAIWKNNYKNKELSDNEIIKTMIKNPMLIERPIIIHNNKAIIGRPPENIKKLLID